MVTSWLDAQLGGRGRQSHVRRAMTLTLTFTLAAAISAATEAENSRVISGLEIFDMQKQLLALEDDKDTVLTDISRTSTVSSHAQDQLGIYTERVGPAVALKNRIQDRLMDRFKKQIEAIMHRVEAMSSEIAYAQTVARDTSEVVDKQIDEFINGSRIAEVQSHQQSKIESIRNMTAADIYSETKEVFDGPFNISFVETVVSLSKYCESGESTLYPGQNDVFINDIRLKNCTSNPTIPEVNLMLTGFDAHLNGSFNGSQGMNILGLKKTLTYVNETGFGVEVEDLNGGGIELNSVSCSWTACINVDNLPAPLSQRLASKRSGGNPTPRPLIHRPQNGRLLSFANF